MSVIVVITQECDGCHAFRELKRGENHELGGWKEVKPNIHLCPACIDKILSLGE